MESKQELNKEEILKKYQQALEFAVERLALREKNLKVDRSANDLSRKSAKMDAINKFKTKLKDNEKKFDQIFKDLDNLNLSKYVAEVAKSISESSIPPKDVLNYMKVATRLHNDYDEFAVEMANNLLKQIDTGGDLQDEASKANRRKNLLRFGFELYLIGLPVPIDKLLGFMRKRFVEDDENVFQHSMNIGINFIQIYTEEFIGTIPRSEVKEREAYPELPQIPKLKELINPEKKRKVLEMLKDFYQKMIGQYKSLHKKMTEQEEIKRQILMTSGKVDDENENKYTILRKNFTTTGERILMVADYLNLEPPNLNMDESVRFVSESETKGQGKDEETKNEPLFDYEEEKDLYLNLPDLRTVVPEFLLFSKKAQEREKQTKKAADTTDASHEKGEEVKEKDEANGETVAQGENPQDTSQTEEKTQPTEEKTQPTEEKAQPTENFEQKLQIKEQPSDEKDLKLQEDQTGATQNTIAPMEGAPKTYEDICLRLDNCDSIVAADNFSRDFCYVNNATNRRKLIGDILAYRKDYPILIPMHMRILATLNVYFKDIAEKFIENLLRDYNNLKNKPEKDKRTRNMLYFCEGSKFRMIPTIHILNCIQECLNSFSGINVELVIYILEKAGTFLMRNKNKDDKMRFELQLTQINNFKTKANLQNNIYLQVENAYFLCRPPERTALKSKKKLTDLENFIRYLFFEKIDEDKVLIENILRLPVKKCEDYLIKIFMKVATRGRYGQMNKICAILRYIGQLYPQLQVRITDQVIEHILSGLETNYSGDRQKRITMIKFFAELFNYQVIEKDLVFKMLYFIMDSGYDQPNPKIREILDPKDDTFRVTLICTLLEETSEFFKKRKYKDTIDKFLIFFQKYILSKTYVPMNVEFQILDLFDILSPNLKKFQTYKEAQEACNLVAKVQDFEEDTQEMDEMRTTTQENSRQLKTEADIEKERQNDAQKEDLDFEDEFQEFLRQNVNEAQKTQGSIYIKPPPIGKIKEKSDSFEEQNINPGKKKIVLCVRQGNKVIAKNVAIDKSSGLAQTISKKEEENKISEELAKDSAKALHKDIVGRTDYIYGSEGFIGNEQIRYMGSKK